MSFVIHVSVIVALSVVVLPTERFAHVFSIVSENAMDDRVNDNEVVKIEEPPDLLDSFEMPSVDAVSPESTADEAALEKLSDAQADTLLGTPDFPVGVVPEVADVGSLMTPLGAGKNGNGIGSGDAGAKIQFFGVKAAGQRVVFVTDCSSSMRGVPMKRLKVELHEAISALPPQAEFYIVFFNQAAVPMPTPEMAAATRRNVDKYLTWADQAEGLGGTDPSQALRIALELKPAVIFLLTDGVFAPQPTFDVINRLNKDRDIQINTIAIGQPEAGPLLKQIADENKGVYTFVPSQ